MREPRWISTHSALAIHGRQIAEHGGDNGVRDLGLLESALARPKNVFAYEEDSADLIRCAAAYLFGIAKNHPFIDGNKRSAAVVCEAFVNLNGGTIDAPDEDFYEVVIAVVENRLDEDRLVNWLRLNSTLNQ